MKRRRPLRPRKPLSRGPGPKRRTRLAASNPARRASLREAQFGDHADRVRGMPCAVCGAPPPSDPHHVKSRGAGGTSADLVPLCRRDHNELHRIGRRTFEREHDIDLAATAQHLHPPTRRHNEEER